MIDSPTVVLAAWNEALVMTGALRTSYFSACVKALPGPVTRLTPADPHAWTLGPLDPGPTRPWARASAQAEPCRNRCGELPVDPTNTSVSQRGELHLNGKVKLITFDHIQIKMPVC